MLKSFDIQLRSILLFFEHFKYVCECDELGVFLEISKC